MYRCRNYNYAVIIILRIHLDIDSLDKETYAYHTCLKYPFHSADISTMKRFLYDRELAITGIGEFTYLGHGRVMTDIQTTGT